MNAITRTPVASSNVVSVGYDEASRTLQVEFKGGAIYEYADVPGHEFRLIMKADSFGQAMNERIKPYFTATKVFDPKEQGAE